MMEKIVLEEKNISELTVPQTPQGLTDGFDSLLQMHRQSKSANDYGMHAECALWEATMSNKMKEKQLTSAGFEIP